MVASAVVSPATITLCPRFLHGPVTVQEHDDNRRRLDDNFGGIPGLAKRLRVDLTHGLATEQVTVRMPRANERSVV